MKRAIWKYELDIDDGRLSKAVPIGARLLSIVELYDKPVAYFLVDPGEGGRDFFTYLVWGTGHRHDASDLDGMRFYATVPRRYSAGLSHDGHLVWHIFVEVGQCSA